MSRKDIVREVLSVIDSLTCLYTELAKSYFLLGPLMAEENTRCEGCGYHHLSTRFVEEHAAHICVVCYPHEDVDA